MGHKEDLLAGAKKCLLELGYAKTTARDIVAASGTNLASIGYHFGSKDALMTQAIIELLGDWGGKFAPPDNAGDLGYRELFALTWKHLIEAIKSDPKLALASFENFVYGARAPEISAIIGGGQQDARQSFGEDFSDPRTPADARTRQAVGSLMLAITTGIIAQWLVDPKRAPSGDDIVTAFQYIADAFGRETSKD